GEAEMVRRRLARGSALPQPRQVTDAAGVLAMRESLEGVHVDPDVLGYVVELVTATRKHPKVMVGASPRGTLAIIQLARGHAGLLLLAAPLLAALAAVPHGCRPDDVEISATASATRCFEREDIELTVTATVAGQMEAISFQLELPPEFGLVTGSAVQVTLD